MTTRCVEILPPSRLSGFSTQVHTTVFDGAVTPPNCLMKPLFAPVKLFCFSLFGLLPMNSAPVHAQNSTNTSEPVIIQVDNNRILRSDADRFVGINLNYLRDSDANRPHARPLRVALREMGAKWLRYPGGEKSDFHRWALPPYSEAKSRTIDTLGLKDGLAEWYHNVYGERLSFDDYIAICRKTGAQPFVVVGFDNQERTGLTEDQWLESAVAWVKYANITKKYGVKYWEIGNENWHNDTTTPVNMGRVVGRFARAMKAVDPTIQIGAGGWNDKWWSSFLPTAAPSLDFVSYSYYTGWDWRSYDYWLKNPHLDLREQLKDVVSAIEKFAPQNDRGRLQIVVTETNSMDWSDEATRWPWENNLGHALVTFENLGMALRTPQVHHAMVWNTRWADDAEATADVSHALGAKNQILPTGRAVQLWNEFALPLLVETSSSNPNVSAYAAFSSDHKMATVWVVNRALAAQDALQLHFKNGNRISHPVTLHRLSGTGSEDKSPNWEKLPPLHVKSGTISFTAPAVSISVLSLRFK